MANYSLQKFPVHLIQYKKCLVFRVFHIFCNPWNHPEFCTIRTTSFYAIVDKFRSFWKCFRKAFSDFSLTFVFAKTVQFQFWACHQPNPLLNKEKTLKYNLYWVLGGSPPNFLGFFLQCFSQKICLLKFSGFLSSKPSVITATLVNIFCLNCSVYLDRYLVFMFKLISDKLINSGTFKMVNLYTRLVARPLMRLNFFYQVWFWRSRIWTTMPNIDQSRIEPSFFILATWLLTLY